MKMSTINFKFDNGQQFMFTAPSSTPISKAIAEARAVMPSEASRFRMVGRYTSGWMS